jgi:hypothetical protein
MLSGGAAAVPAVGQMATQERQGERKQKNQRKKEKVTNEPHLSVVDPTFDVFTPNRKWVDQVVISFWHSL